MKHVLLITSLLLINTATTYAGGNTNQETDPAGDADEDGSLDGTTVSCPEGEIAIDNYCFPDPDAGDHANEGGSRGGGGGDCIGCPRDDGGSKDDGIDIVGCLLRAGGALFAWGGCVGTSPVVGTGVGAGLPAAVCFGASLTTASAVKICTGN